MANSLASVKLLEGDLGKITAAQIAESINPDDVHAPETTLVSLENTMNKGGGSIYTLDEIKPIQTLCQEKGIKLHLDGARLFNALVASGEKTQDWGATFDTISICLSKGLGCPVGHQTSQKSKKSLWWRHAPSRFFGCCRNLCIGPSSR